MADIVEFDELKMWFCEPYKVNDYITIHQPSIGGIVEWGEKRYYGMIHTLTCIPSDMKSQLYDAGIDYEQIQDYELFCILAKTLKQEDTEIIFGDLDLSKMTNNGEAHKRFDFVVKGKSGMAYGIECNFYTSQGSKLNETARSYKMIAEECKSIKGFTFVWFTDGKGWNSAKNNLKETFDVLKDIYCINEIENGIMKEVLK